MRCIKIPLVQTGQIHKLTSDYISGNEALKPLYAYKPTLDGIAKAIEHRKNFPVNRTMLVDSLKSQYQKTYPCFFENDDNILVSNNISSLSNENTFTVTTGHQLNIFTGPLYYIYKIVSVINYAKILKKSFPLYDFVPVYWMATEDHDLEEINHFHIWGKTYTWDAEKEGAVGLMNPASLSAITDEIAGKMGNSPYAESLIELFRKAYSDQKTLAEATRYIVNELFKSDGLIVIDGDDSELKKALVPVIENDIFEIVNFKAINNTLSSLEKNYKIPVTPREINVFYLGEKSRSRIVNEDGKYKVMDTSKSWNEEELRNEIKTNPENFSPNVVLRPMYQELILPNLAYIGGNSEIAYWLELKNAFLKEDIFFPQLLVRDSALFVGLKINTYLELFKLKPDDLFLSLPDLQFKFYDVNMLEHASEKDTALILEQYETLRNDLQGLPGDLVGNIVKQMNLQIKEVRKWKNDIHNRQLELQEKNIAKLDKIYQAFYPEGELQERYDNFIPYYLQYGPKWLEMLKEEFNVLESACHIFVEEESNETM